VKARGLHGINPYTQQVVQQSTYFQRQYVQQTFKKQKISPVTKLKHTPLTTLNVAQIIPLTEKPFFSITTDSNDAFVPSWHKF